MTPSAEAVWVEDLNLWWPVADGDPHQGHGSVIGRIKDVDLTIARCARRRTVVQAGAHVGLWPLRLAKAFARVLAFEIMPGCYAAAVKNCAGKVNVTVSPLGLGAVHGAMAPMSPRFRAGSWQIDPAGDLTAAMTTIDTLGLADCDAIVLDVEGYEVEALKGAAETIARCRPVIHVEELPRSRDAIRAHLAGLGYRAVHHVHADAIYVPA